MNNQLTVITVSYNSSDFIELLLFSLKKLSFYKLEILICDNGSTHKEIEQLKKILHDYKKCFSINLLSRKQKYTASFEHATALDLMIKKIKTPYFMVMDADAVLLKKNWDKILVDEINYAASDVIGAPPVPNKIKNVDFPSVYTTLFRTSVFRTLNSSFIPNRISFGEDTGYMIRKNYKKNKKKSIIFDVINTRHDHDKYYFSVLCATYYYQNSLIASHFGRGSTNGYVKYSKIISKFPFIGNFLINHIGTIEKKKWIAISKKIIEFQSTQND